jgi:asparagine synthase (glutamine-hydrolysing)
MDLFVFSTSRRILLDLKLAPVELNELYLAQVLVSWSAYHGERTIHSPIRRLPPAHALTVTPDRIAVGRYWRLEDTSELRLARREDYVAGLRDVFDRAVRERLPRAGTLAATLSGGLDSGSVAATAAGMLRDRGRRLTAYTSVPLSDPSPYFVDEFGDEFPFARRTAETPGNIDLRRIESRGLNPLQRSRPRSASASSRCMPRQTSIGCSISARRQRGTAMRACSPGRMGNGGFHGPAMSFRNRCRCSSGRSASAGGRRETQSISFPTRLRMPFAGAGARPTGRPAPSRPISRGGCGYSSAGSKTPGRRRPSRRAGNG